MNPSQLDLFSEVLHAYSAERGGALDNATLYADVAVRAGLPEELLSERVPVGKAGQPHNLIARRVRWHQQTLKHAGILQRVEGQRGVWKLTEPAGKDLNRIGPNVGIVGFSTDLGVAILGACETVFERIDAPITLCLASPPYALAKARSYGNPSEAEYVDWICRTLEPIVRNLVRGGSICLNVSNDIFMPGSPARSLYRERLVLALHDRLGLHKVDELIWHNPSKPPGPVQYASIQRVQLNVAWEPIYWLSNCPQALRSNNRRVLQEHTERHLRLIRQGGEQRDAEYSDGAYRIHPGRFGNATIGRIPRNVLAFGHSCADQRAYKAAARAAGLPSHGAPMPLSLASFLVEFLSSKDDLVVDPTAARLRRQKRPNAWGGVGSRPRSCLSMSLAPQRGFPMPADSCRTLGWRHEGARSRLVEALQGRPLVADKRMSETKGPWVLAVGQPFSPKRSKWDDGRFEFRYFSGNHMLQLCLGRLTPREIKAFRKNPVRVALYVERNVIFFLFKIEGCMDWSDQGFSIHLVHEQNRDLPPLPPGMRRTLNLVLVDADTGVVRALRMVTFSPHYSRLLHDAMRRQIDAPFDPAAHHAVIQDVYRRYPRTTDLAKAAVIIEKAGAKFP